MRPSKSGTNSRRSLRLIRRRKQTNKTCYNDDPFLALVVLANHSDFNHLYFTQFVDTQFKLLQFLFPFLFFIFMNDSSLIFRLTSINMCSKTSLLAAFFRASFSSVKQNWLLSSANTSAKISVRLPSTFCYYYLYLCHYYPRHYLQKPSLLYSHVESNENKSENSQKKLFYSRRVQACWESRVLCVCFMRPLFTGTNSYLCVWIFSFCASVRRIKRDA